MAGKSNAPIGSLTQPNSKDLIWDASKGRAAEKHLAVGLVLNDGIVVDVYQHDGIYSSAKTGVEIGRNSNGRFSTSANVHVITTSTGKVIGTLKDKKLYCVQSSKLVAFQKASGEFALPWWTVGGIEPRYAVKGSNPVPTRSNATVFPTGTNRPAWYGRPTAPGTRFSRLGAGE